MTDTGAGLESNSFDPIEWNRSCSMFVEGYRLFTEFKRYTLLDHRILVGGDHVQAQKFLSLSDFIMICGGKGTKGADSFVHANIWLNCEKSFGAFE
jgi:hypothetical protein